MADRGVTRLVAIGQLVRVYRPGSSSRTVPACVLRIHPAGIEAYESREDDADVDVRFYPWSRVARL